MTAFLFGSVVYLAALFSLAVAALVAFNRKRDLLGWVLTVLAVVLLVGGTAYLIQLGEVAR
jgi:FtsH-binding integral membrane protein